MTGFDFRNVDLDIHSRSSLDALLVELGESVVVLHSESKPNKHVAHLESARCWKSISPDKTIKALCDLLETLSPKGLQTWRKARQKIFNIGLHIDPKASHTEFSLSNESARRIAKLGATITITIYNESNFKFLASTPSARA